jgi:hypothetical protein
MMVRLHFNLHPQQHNLKRIWRHAQGDAVGWIRYHVVTLDHFSAVSCREKDSDLFVRICLKSIFTSKLT